MAAPGRRDRRRQRRGPPCGPGGAVGQLTPDAVAGVATDEGEMSDLHVAAGIYRAHLSDGAKSPWPRRWLELRFHPPTGRG